MARRRNVPVLIVGGGPAGLAAACELWHHGVGSVVVEPRRTVADDRPRAKTVSARTMEHFRRWGIADAVRRAAPLAPDWSDRVVFCESLTGRRLTEFTDCFGLTVRPDQAAERGQQIPQPLVERVLREHLAGAPEVELMLGSRAIDLARTPDGVDVSVQDDAGVVTVLSADYVLGCDGAGGITRTRCGVAYRGTSDPRPNVNVVFRAPGLHTDLGPAVQYWVVGARAAGLLGRLDLLDRWWAIVPGADPRSAADPSALVHRLVGREVEHEIVATDPWTARMLLADRFRRGRVFLLGEAAHVNPPWGGHGYNTSVGDAVNLGWKLAAVLQGWGGPALLDSYQLERRPIAEQTLRVAAANQAVLASDLAGPAGPGGSAELIQRTKRAEFHSLGLVLGSGYAGSPIVQPGPDPAGDPTVYRPSTDPGQRLPPAPGPGRTSLYDRLGRGFTLLGPIEADPGPVAALVGAARARGVPIEAVAAPPDYPWRSEFLLVRPDQHIAARCARAADVDLDRARGLRPDPGLAPGPGATPGPGGDQNRGLM